jgi:hypothetical protein
MSGNPGFIEGIGDIDNLLRDVKAQQKRTNELLAQIAQSGGLNVGSGIQQDAIGGSFAHTLALRGGWEYEITDLRDEEFQPGETFEIETTQGPGWVFFAILNVIGEGGENTEVTIRTDSSVIDTTIKERYLSGLHSPQEYLPFVPLYNTRNESYSIAFYAVNGYQYKEGFRFAAAVPNDIPGPVKLNLAVSRVIIKDEEQFLRADYE